MAKKTPKSLKQRIDDLANAMGGSEKPAYADVRSQLFDFSAAAEELQNGASIRETEEKIARLEEANEALKAEIETEREEFNAEKEYLKVQILEAKYEIDRFREEEKEREKKEQDIPEIQFEILSGLPGEHEEFGSTLEGISRRANIPTYEGSVHLDKLIQAGFAKRTCHDLTGGRIMSWHRTLGGDNFMLAKRLAGEEAQPNTSTELGENAKKVLTLIAREDGLDETAIAERMKIRLSVIRRILRLLREEGMATDAEEPEKPGEGFTISNGRPIGPVWRLLLKGEDYLAKRSSL